MLPSSQEPPLPSPPPPLTGPSAHHIDLNLEQLGVSSIGGGVSPLFAREKFCGPYEFNGITLAQMARSFRLYNDEAPDTDGVNAPGRFRSCARVTVPETDISKLFAEVKEFHHDHPAIPLEVEYCYRCGGNQAHKFVVGLGMNAPLRYVGEHYEGARQSQTLDPRYRRPFERTDIEALQDTYGRRKVMPDNRFTVATSMSMLDSDQMKSLTELLQTSFGAQWTSTAIKHLDSRPSDVLPTALIDDLTGEVAAFTLAEWDHETKTVEVTEWVARPQFPGAGAQVMSQLVSSVVKTGTDYRIFGEFNSSRALRSALRVGFRLPEIHPDAPAESILFANVWVEQLTDFVALVWPDDELHTSTN